MSYFKRVHPTLVLTKPKKKIEIIFFTIAFYDFQTTMTSSPEKREHLYKILVIGELGTGKTSFIKRYVHQFFSQNYRATIGVGKKKKKIEIFSLETKYILVIQSRFCVESVKLG